MRIKRLTEAEFTAQVLQYAKLRGWRSAHFRAARLANGSWRTPVQGDGAGFPDLVLVRAKRIVVAELKVGAPVAENQTEWLAAFRAANVPAYLWRPCDWDEILEVLQ